MNNKIKVIVSAALIALVISLLWFVIPATPIWTISYIFTILAILGIAISFIAYTQRATRVPQGHAFPISAVTYAVVSTIFSIIAVWFDYNGHHFHSVWYTIIHTAIFVFFIICIIALLAGSEYIDKVGEQAKQKHNELNKDKKNYWK